MYVGTVISNVPSSTILPHSVVFPTIYPVTNTLQKFNVWTLSQLEGPHIIKGYALDLYTAASLANPKLTEFHCNSKFENNIPWRLKMGISRRQFIKGSLTTGAVAAAAGMGIFDPRRAYPFAQTTPIRKFVTHLPGVTPLGANEIGQYITLLKGAKKQFAGLQTDVYNVVASKFYQKMHPDLPGKTTFYGYCDLSTRDTKYLGGAIVAKRGTPVLLNVTNVLPSQHFLPVDPTVMAGPNGLMVGDLPQNRIAVHLHGGFSPWFSDGTPFQWFTPSSPNMRGPSFKNVPGTNPPPGTTTLYWTNQQSARMMWYHDHAIGLTRLNAYAGIATAYFLTDDFEQWLGTAGLLPFESGPETIPDFDGIMGILGVPLVIQEKTFVGTDISTKDPTWHWGAPGSLWYPHDYEVNTFSGGLANPSGRWDWGPTVIPPSVGTMPLPPVSNVPEFFADTAMVNGAPYPVYEVESHPYRFRILNGSQARFWHLNLYRELGTTGEADLTAPGPAMYQIGTEGGFLPAVAVHLNGRPCPLDLVADPTGNTAKPDGPFNLLLGPAERADILIDFTGCAGQTFILYSDAPGPFPGGDPRNDYFTGAPDQTASGGAAPTVQGMGPNTRTIMKFNVTLNQNNVGIVLDDAWLQNMNMALANNFKGSAAQNPGVAPQQDALLAPWNPATGQFEIPAGVTIYNKTLNEDFDEFGRLIQMAGTDVLNGLNNQGMPTFSRGYLEAATEIVNAGEIQVWDFYNTTGDTHPWHFHLVNVQVLGRGLYAINPVTGTPQFGSFTDLSGVVAGKLTPPDANEMGWKETVRMNPGEVTRVIMKFDLPILPAVMGDPKSPRFPGGREYVHHCHILEHEEHDMMRPLVVV